MLPLLAMFAEISNSYIMLGGALGMIVLGLAICYLSAQAGSEGLKKLFWWVGIIVAVLGLLLFIIRPLIWLAKQISEAIGA